MPSYYPSLSDLLAPDFAPDTIGNATLPGAQLLDDIFYKNLRVDKSVTGDVANYRLTLLLRKTFDFEIPGSLGAKLTLNEGQNTSNYSELDILFAYQLPVLGYIRDFNLAGFDFSAKSVYKALLKIAAANDNVLLLSAINNFFTTYEDRFGDFVSVYQSAYGKTLSIANINADELVIANELVQQVNTQGYTVANIIGDLYIQSQQSNSVEWGNIFCVFKPFLGQIDFDSFTGFIRPRVVLALNDLNAAIEFPRTVFQPLDASGNVLPDPAKAKLTFQIGNLQYSTENGFEFNSVGSLSFTKAAILNSGFTLEIHDAKIDLSKTSNIPEADADGRPKDFIGMYVKEATIGFPDAFGTANSNSTTSLTTRNLLVGTGGISGTIELDNPTGFIKRDFGLFAITLDTFSLSFQQSRIISSGISGTLSIPGFKVKDTSGYYIDAIIGIHASISEDGDFKITAALNGNLVLEIPDVLAYTINGLTLAKKGSSYFISTSGTLDFTLGSSVPGVSSGILPKNIGIKKLVIWENGKIELEGGNISLPDLRPIKIGPVKISVSSMHFGTQDIGARSYYFFGFDGRLNISPGGVDARGNGIKLYYSEPDTNGARDIFFRIDGIAIDIRLPSGAESDKEAELLLKGYLAMRNADSTGAGSGDPGTEYQGNVSFTLNKLGMQGSAGMRINPDKPSFVVDIGLELSTPIPLASTGLGIYGFRGLIGTHYTVSKHAGGISDEEPWWHYYKAPKTTEGVTIDKLEDSKGFAFGAGISLATASDNGKAFSSKLFFLLGIPEILLLQGQASILSERVGLDPSADPPFSAFMVLTPKSIEAGFGVNYAVPNSGGARGKVLDMQAQIEMAYFFGNASAWYINVGKENPASERVRASLLTLFDAYAYLMLSAQGIRAGAGASWSFDMHCGPVSIGAGMYLNTGGHISFKPLQIGGFIDMGGYAYLRVFGFKFGMSVGAYLGMEAFKPFKVLGSFHVSIGLPWPFDDVDVEVSLSWTMDSSVDKDPIPILSVDADKPAAIALNMMSKESFPVIVLNGSTIPASGDPVWNTAVIPMDSYIDINLSKSVKVTGQNINLSGELYSPDHQEMVPPQRGVSEQVAHSFEITNITLKASSDAVSWTTDYNVYLALENLLLTFPDVTHTMLTGLPNAYWQLLEPGKNTRIRVMSQNVFSYLTQVAPGSFTLEYSGFKGGNIFCYKEKIAETCVDWESVGTGTPYDKDVKVALTPEVSFRPNKTAAEVTSWGASVPPENFSQAVFLPSQNSIFDSEKGFDLVFETLVTYFEIWLSIDPQGASALYPNVLRIRYYKEDGTYSETLRSVSSLSDPDSFKLVYDNSAVPISRINVVGKGRQTRPTDPFSQSDLYFGGRPSTSDYLEGCLDDIRIYNRWLNVADVDTLYTDYENNMLSPGLPTPLAWWKLDNITGTSVPVTGPYSPGTFHGSSGPSPVNDVRSIPNAALQFVRASSNYIEVPHHADFSFQEADFGISLWFKLPVYPGPTFLPDPNEIHTLIDKIEERGPDEKYGYRVYIQDNTINVEMWNVNLTNMYQGHRFDYWLNIYDNNWHHLFFAGYYSEQKFELTINRLWNLTGHWWGPYFTQWYPQLPKDVDVNRDIYLHKLCYLTREAHIYNENLPSYESILALQQNLGDGMNKTVQPIWRPDTFYAIQVEGKDGVDPNVLQHYTFAFKTKGPIGHFHQYNKMYQDVYVPDRINEFKLSGLKYYIDYSKAYPNADGNLLDAKPLHYKAPKLYLYFNQPYVKLMYSDWQSYNSLPVVSSALKAFVIDPLSDGTNGKFTLDPHWSAPESFDYDEEDVKVFNNLADDARMDCENNLGPITRLGFSLHYECPDLQPMKAYMASYEALYKSAQEIVHQYVFQTSRYDTFRSQVESFMTGSPNLYTLAKAFDATSAFKILFNPDASSEDLVTRFPHAFDRLMYVLQLAADLKAPQRTEVNILLNVSSNTVIGLLIRSPEPFIDPKMADADRAQTITVSNTVAGAPYTFLYSKDCAGVFITTHNTAELNYSPAGTSLNIPAGALVIGFSLPVYNGLNYVFGSLADNNATLNISLAPSVPA